LTPQVVAVDRAAQRVADDADGHAVRVGDVEQVGQTGPEGQFPRQFRHAPAQLRRLGGDQRQRGRWPVRRDEVGPELPVGQLLRLPRPGHRVLPPLLGVPPVAAVPADPLLVRGVEPGEGEPGPDLGRELRVPPRPPRAGHHDAAEVQQQRPRRDQSVVDHVVQPPGAGGAITAVITILPHGGRRPGVVARTAQRTTTR